MGMAERTPREVMLDAVFKIIQALDRGRLSKAVKDLTDLMYYAGVGGFDEAYLKIFDDIMRRVEGKPERFRVRFAESLNTAFEGMKHGNEAVFVGRVLAEAEKIKMERLGRYITPPEDLRREAERIIREAFGER